MPKQRQACCKAIWVLIYRLNLAGFRVFFGMYGRDVARKWGVIMRPKPISFQAVTRQDRHHVMDIVEQAISKAHGWIEDSQLYSNKMATIRFVMDGRQCDAFCDFLRSSDIEVDCVGGAQSMKADPVFLAEIPATIQLTFIHDQPDLRQVIPAVPG